MHYTFSDELFAGADLQIRQVCNTTGFFRDDETDVAAELAIEALEKGQEASGYYFLLVWDDNKLCAFACYGPTPCTLGTWDLYWIVTDQAMQGKGLGKKLLAAIEDRIREQGARKLYIETSSQEKYAPTRNFYIRAQYMEEARLKDFYDTGDDKVIYARYL